MHLAAYENTKCKPPNFQMTTYMDFNMQYMYIGCSKPLQYTSRCTAARNTSLLSYLILRQWRQNRNTIGGAGMRGCKAFA